MTPSLSPTPLPTLSFTLILAVLLPLSAPAERVTPHPPVERETIDLVGWQIQVDRRLLEDPAHSDLGTAAIELLEADLRRIRVLVPARPLAALREVAIVLDLDCGDLRSMQYHPSAGWLRANGYDPALARAVHIPVAAGYIDPDHVFKQPSVILHELAHGYHDQVLGFDHPEIMEAFQAAVASGTYAEVLHITGRTLPHYALTDQKEYFAEATEAWFGTNDFYPFVRAELKLHDPALAGLLAEIWGE